MKNPILAFSLKLSEEDLICRSENPKSLTSGEDSSKFFGRSNCKSSADQGSRFRRNVQISTEIHVVETNILHSQADGGSSLEFLGNTVLSQVNLREDVNSGGDYKFIGKMVNVYIPISVVDRILS
ncbi:uncharacterized protein LOC113337106 [Papaver somniferum]|uniref:uncharacterized protein LOC113337106 n=1 Tax=Papaver somniferum TaxID=3469 RepID=UPI000E6FBA1B|nr:uncharacterized protein LOC113337106 [Papaver somniferum]